MSEQMQLVLLLLVVAAPVTAAIKGVGRRGLWFSLSGVAFVLALGSLAVSTSKIPSTLDPPRSPIIASDDFSERLLRECKEDPERYQGSCAMIEGTDGAITLQEYSRQAFGFFASASLGFLLAGFFHRGKPATELKRFSAPSGPSFSLPFAEKRAHRELSISAREVKGLFVLHVGGDVFLGDTCNALRNQVVQLLGADKKNILLNLQDVARLDSAGIGVLIAGVVETAKEGGQLKLVNVPRLIHNVLVVHRLLSAFELYADEDQAIASFNAN